MIYLINYYHKNWGIISCTLYYNMQAYLPNNKYIPLKFECVCVCRRGGGSPNVPCRLKKWQCPLSLFLKCSCRFLIVQCHLSIFRIINVPCRYFLSILRVQCRLQISEKAVTLSNLRVNAPSYIHLCRLYLVLVPVC